MGARRGWSVPLRLSPHLLFAPLPLNTSTLSPLPLSLSASRQSVSSLLWDLARLWFHERHEADAPELRPELLEFAQRNGVVL